MTGYSFSKSVIKKLISGACIVMGAFLILEHLQTYNGFDLELVGHETLGLILIIIGWAIGIKKWKPVIDEGGPFEGWK